MTTTYVGLNLVGNLLAWRFTDAETHKHYGNGIRLYRNADELAKDDHVATSAMVAIYNKLAPKPVTKFSDRKTAAQRLWAIINEKVPVTERTAKMEPNTETTSGKPAAAMKQAAATAEEKAAAAARKKEEAQKAAEARKADRAADKAEKQKAKDEAKAAKAAEREAKKAEREAAKAAGPHGRKSAFSGKLLRHSIGADAEGDIKNPRRPDSWGWKSLQIIIDAGAKGITTEDYVKAGGRMNDLHWDIDHGNVKVEDVPEVAAA